MLSKKIHINYTNQKFKNIFDEMREDLILKRSDIVVNSFSFENTIKKYSESLPDIDLLILEVNDVNENNIEKKINELSDNLNNTNVILIGDIDNIRFYKKALFLGIDEYIYKENLNTKDLLIAIEKIYLKEGENLKNIISFIGIGGGCGVSNIVANYCYSLKDYDFVYTLLETDITHGNINLLFNDKKINGLRDALKRPNLDEEYLSKYSHNYHNNKFFILSDMPSFKFKESRDPSEIEKVLVNLSKMNKFVFCDLNHIIDDYNEKILSLSSKIIFVTQPNYKNLFLFKNILSYLETIAKNIPIGVVFNKTEEFHDPKAFLEGVNAEYLSNIEYKPKVFEDCAIDGRMVSDVNGKIFSSAFNEFNKFIFNDKIKTEKIEKKDKKKKGLLGGLFKK